MTSGLNQYLLWLQSCLKCATTMPVKGFEEIIIQAPPPDYEALKKEDQIRKLISDYSLCIEAQFILTLCISPIYIQDFLNTLSSKNQNINGASLQNGQFTPTVETAIDVMAGQDVDLRNKYLNYFLSDSDLLNNSLIILVETTKDIYLSKRPIVPTEKTVERIVSGVESKLNFSCDFPAVLLETSLKWDDLVLASDTKMRLQEIEEWLSFGREMESLDIELSGYRKGYKSLFCGPSGTGKTLAASLIGKITGKPVYKIDLSAMVSKYIGETEKNLRKVFDKADHGKWILFFDEADSLFGKRGQTNNAHDRYANQEVSYLLQRFETYEGLAILASNFKENIDVAFTRRFDSIINFRVPEIDERILLWEKHLPESFVFEEDVNLSKISQSIKLTGAQIHNVMKRCIMKTVLRKEGYIIQGKDMYESVQIEYAKENKIL